MRSVRAYSRLVIASADIWKGDKEMRIKFKVNTQWEGAINICEVDYISFLEEEKEIRFILDGKTQIFYSIKVESEYEFKRIEENILLYGIYDLSDYATMVSCNGGKDWVCINRPEEVKDGKVYNNA